MPNRRTLSPKFIEGLKPAPTGKRVDYLEAITPGFGVRVTDSGAKSFILVARFPGSPNPTRRTIGNASKMLLADARKKAAAWTALLANGDDPAEVEREAVATKARKRANTFGSIMEEYIVERVKKQRRGAKVEREIRLHLMPEWQARPIANITKADVSALVRKIARDSGLYQAHNVFGHIQTFFNWIIGTREQGIETSPCDRLKISALVGAKKARQRVLTDDELLAYSRAAAAAGQPFGPLFALLALTGQRRDEVSGARWREFHPALVRRLRERGDSAIDWSQVPASEKVWTIPAERFKSDRSHVVPLSDDACAVLAELPFFAKGDHLFSTTYGERPVSGFSKAKARLDKHMKRAIEDLAPFVIHDVRRTVRTRLSALRVPDHVAEMVIGHGRKGIQGTYDVHSYLDEKRDALERWSRQLRAIVEPPPSNVFVLQAKIF